MTALDIIKCFPNYSTGNLRVGDIIKPQNVALPYQISVQIVKEYFKEMIDQGYLVYEEGNETKIAGYHLTEKGLNLVR